ncbi:MAG: FAD-dependent oxidoreductase [Firmicutes bacterium]|nr:FAD-dependent oxidoreductase [Bacillota bacterium]
MNEYELTNLKQNYDILIIGAGPAGIFTTLEILRRGGKQKIALIDQGGLIGQRNCPKLLTGSCLYCKPHCHITSGFAGAGAFSDGKLSLSCDVGGDLPDLIGRDKTQSLIDYTDKIYLDYGADTRIEGVSNPEAIKKIRGKAIGAGLKLIDCPIRHLGTEKARGLYQKIQQALLGAGADIIPHKQCDDLIIQNRRCYGAIVGGIPVKSCKTVVATGRRGAGWLEAMCVKHGIENEAGNVDIGVRVELRNEIMEEINQILYEGKFIGYPQPYKNKVRTFCQNPGGYVAQENYEDDLAVVNGHSYKEKKSDNTNLAILCTHHFTVPFNQPILYAKKVGQLINMLAGGSILVQRLGDIREGKRTWQNELDKSNLRPTLPGVVAGDITSALPYRTMVGILNFIEQVDKVVPGFGGNETLLYAPEIKFYSNRIKMDARLSTSVADLHCLGDSSGWTRGLMMSSVMGIYLGGILTGKGSGIEG